MFEPSPPGPAAREGRNDPSLVPGPGETLDCLSGRWKIFQLRSGHRYSTDDLLLAWAAVRGFGDRERPPRRHLDLGCGVGSVGLLALWRVPGLHLLGIEAQQVSAALAQRSVRYNGVGGRAEIRTGDFREPGVLRPGEQFDLITCSPPYLVPGEGRRSDRPQRGPCRFEDRGGVGDYLRVAASRLVPRGIVVWVHATRYLEANLDAAHAAGLEAVSWRRVVFREGKESVITLFRAAPCPALPPEEEDPLVVRRRDGDWSDEYREVRRAMGFPCAQSGGYRASGRLLLPQDSR